MRICVHAWRYYQNLRLRSRINLERDGDGVATDGYCHGASEGGECRGKVACAITAVGVSGFRVTTYSKRKIRCARRKAGKVPSDSA